MCIADLIMTFILVRICKTNKRKSLFGLTQLYFSHCKRESLTWNTYSDHLKKNAMVMNKDFSDVILVTKNTKQMWVQHMLR